jgi:hypothetical protein
MFHLYDVETEDGPVRMIAVLPPETAVERGLPSPAVVGTVPHDAAEITIETFTPNPEFATFLGFVVAKHGAADPSLVRQAAAEGDGWVYMIDLRAGPDDEEIADEDILGAFHVEGGEVVPGSYRGNPGHQILTARGLPQLDAWLEEKLVEELLALD